jgi:hypothetical protein
VYAIGQSGSTTLNVYSQNNTTPATQLSNSGNGDVFIAKYDTNGVVLWAAKMGGSIVDEGQSISVDSSGNVYVTGYYDSDPLNVYSQNNTTPATQLSNSGSRDVFIAKYDTNGVAQWAARVAGSGYDYGSGISVDSSGNVYITGYYDNGPLNVYSQGSTTPATQLSNSGNGDVFIAKYDTNGVVQWAARAAGSDNDYGYGISVDGTGNVYVTGNSFSPTLNLYNTDGGDSGITLSKMGIVDTFIAKYNVPNISITSLDSSNSLVINTNVGIGTNQPQANLHVEGNVYVSSNLEVGTANLFIDTVNSRVGIGTTSPTQKLDVNGVIKSNVPSWGVHQLSTVSGDLQFTDRHITEQNCTVSLSTGSPARTRITATVAGLYFVCFTAFTESTVSAGTNVQISLKKNGSTYSRNFHQQPISDYSATGGLAVVVDLAVNDYLEVSSDQPLHHNASGYFSGFLIG